MKIRLIAVPALMLLAASAWAADFAGKWQAEADGVQVTLTFRVDGNALTGTVDHPQAGPTEIKEGKIDGDTISFHVVRTFSESEVKVFWKGTAAGGDIKFIREAPGFQGGTPTEITAKRAK